MSPARVLQRWLVLQRYNKEVIRALPYCFTGLTKWPHTLGARVCALRALILADTKRKVSEYRLHRKANGFRVIRVPFECL
jgi:hypothetical protein